MMVCPHSAFDLSQTAISNLAFQIEVAQCVEDSHWFKIQTN